MRFSQRIGITPQKKEVQIENLDTELRNGLWNLLKMLFLDNLSTYSQYDLSDYKKFAQHVWHDFYKLPIDTIPEYKNSMESEIREWFFQAEWYDVYDFLEFVIRIQANNDVKYKLINALNVILEREFSGYRIVDDCIAPISNQLEFDEVSNALKKN